MKRIEPYMAAEFRLETANRQLFAQNRGSSKAWKPERYWPEIR